MCLMKKFAQKSPPISVVVTVLNEEQSIEWLLQGLINQAYFPSEVIIIDGGSTDRTLQLIKVFQKKHPKFTLVIQSQSGNRSQGRNLGINLAKNEVIAITDAGCSPKKDWLKKLVEKYQLSQADVVAGYYQARPERTSHPVLAAAITPYMLVMPDQIDENNFLPATRSMLLKKSAWKRVGGFSESLVLSEDYDFAQRLQNQGLKIAFSKKAVVGWLPADSLSDFFQTVVGMARGDTLAKKTRIKAILVLLRYLIVALIVLSFGCASLILCLGEVLILGLLYGGWAMWKNAAYLDRGYGYLAILQLMADIGVIWGTLRGYRERVLKKVKK